MWESAGGPRGIMRLEKTNKSEWGITGGCNGSPLSRSRGKNVTAASSTVLWFGEGNEVSVASWGRVAWLSSWSTNGWYASCGKTRCEAGDNHPATNLSVETCWMTPITDRPWISLLPMARQVRSGANNQQNSCGNMGEVRCSKLSEQGRTLLCEAFQDAPLPSKPV